MGQMRGRGDDFSMQERRGGSGEYATHIVGQVGGQRRASVTTSMAFQLVSERFGHDVQHLRVFCGGPPSLVQGRRL
jgi:hypothetical protein